MPHGRLREVACHAQHHTAGKEQSQEGAKADSKCSAPKHSCRLPLGDRSPRGERVSRAGKEEGGAGRHIPPDATFSDVSADSKADDGMDGPVVPVTSRLGSVQAPVHSW